MDRDLFLAVRLAVILSVVVYFVFDHFDGKRVRDEREELIRLKTFELLQKLNMWALTLISIWFVFEPQMPAIVPVIALVVTSLYGEIFGKIYYRRQL